MCLDPNVGPLWEIPIEALYSGYLWLRIPREPNKFHKYTQLSRESSTEKRFIMFARQLQPRHEEFSI